MKAGTIDGGGWNRDKPVMIATRRMHSEVRKITQFTQPRPLSQLPLIVPHAVLLPGIVFVSSLSRLLPLSF